MNASSAHGAFADRDDLARGTERAMAEQDPGGKKKLKLKVEHLADLKGGAGLAAENKGSAAAAATGDKVRSKDNHASTCGPVSK